MATFADLMLGNLSGDAVTLADLTLVQAAEAVRDGDATSRDLLSACWERMEAVNPTLNATIWVDRLGAEQVPCFVAERLEIESMGQPPAQA